MSRIALVWLLLWCVWGQALAETFRFSAPPRLGAKESREIFEPLAALLGERTGHTFEYVHPHDWFGYQSGMREGRFDVLLDDAHFASWRIAALEHVPLVRARENVRFVTIAAKSGRIYSKEDLIARLVCASPPPDLGTVGFLRQFNGPFRVPQVLATPDPLDRVQRLLAGECAGAVLARNLYTGSREIRRIAGNLKIITQTDSYPGLTLTAGTRLPEDLRASVQRLLLSRAGGEATRGIRERFAGGGSFVEADPAEYDGLNALLADHPGFEAPPDDTD